ncbi:MAG TPA: hypothetical protein VFT00_07495 [Nocardioides sp.]|nr:hypothetical protein [Nocardioides sp.]
MSGLPALGLAAGLLAALVFGFAAVLQAHAVRRLGAQPENLVAFLLASARDPWTLLVVAGYLVGFVLHAVAIWLLPLYLAQAAIAMSLPVTVIASILLEGGLRAAHWWAIGVVTLGLVLLAAGSGDAGSVLVTTPFVVALWAGLLLLGVAARLGIGLGGAALGALSGLGYAGSAIAVRGVGTPVEILVVAAALAVPVYGVLAFWLYSLGMDRARVSSATTPMIVGSTFVPAGVGLALLGDGVRPGWWAAVVAGLVLATAGTVVLSRDDVRSRAAAESASGPGPAPRPGP